MIPSCDLPYTQAINKSCSFYCQNVPESPICPQLHCPSGAWLPPSLAQNTYPAPAIARVRSYTLGNWSMVAPYSKSSLIFPLSSGQNQPFLTKSGLSFPPLLMSFSPMFTVFTILVFLQCLQTHQTVFCLPTIGYIGFFLPGMFLPLSPCSKFLLILQMLIMLIYMSPLSKILSVHHVQSKPTSSKCILNPQSIKKFDIREEINGTKEKLKNRL